MVLNIVFYIFIFLFVYIFIFPWYIVNREWKNPHYITLFCVESLTRLRKSSCDIIIFIIYKKKL